MQPYRLFGLVAGLLIALSSGCTSVGPRAIQADRFDYNGVISKTRDEELLLNLVRVRYGETPLFMDVAQVLTQYSQLASARVQGDIGIDAPSGDPASSKVTPEIRGEWFERPTITYAPRTGPKFTKSLLRPIDPAGAFTLALGGWPTDIVLRRVIRAINGIRVRSLSTGEWNPRYSEMLAAIGTAVDFGALGLGEKEGQATLRFRTEGVKKAGLEALATLRELWGLDPEISEYRVVFGVVPDNPNEIAILTSSVLDLLRDYAAFIAVPQDHVDQGWTTPTAGATPDEPLGRAPIRVQVTNVKPVDANVAVTKFGRWYSIPREDLWSKQMFSLLMILLQLVEDDAGTVGPTITVGTG